MSMIGSYKMRLRRKRWLARAFRKRRELREVSNKTLQIDPSDVLLFATIRNEHQRLPYFLKYYRDLGVDHFVIVDNGSTDGSEIYLTEQPDVTTFRTDTSYGLSRFGMDWINWLLMKYAHGHWALVVDADEFLVFPFCDTRPITALTDWLDGSGIRSFGTLLLDMYPKGPLTEAVYSTGQNPFEVASWFDSGNYMLSRNPGYGNLWIQGGPRARAFFTDDPKPAPALNKVPLVKWDRSYAYVSSTHLLLPRGLNRVYETQGGERISGCLLHAKFLNTFTERAAEEARRGEHYANAREYAAYQSNLAEHPEIWCSWSEKYINWRQLEILGLMSSGNWA